MTEVFDALGLTGTTKGIWTPAQLRPLLWLDAARRNYSGQIWPDLSGHGNHVLLGSTTGADGNDPAWINGGLQFDGVDDYVGCGKSSYQWSTQPWSAIVVAKSTDEEAVHWRTILDLTNSSASDTISLAIGSNSKLYLGSWSVGGVESSAPAGYMLSSYRMLVLSHIGNGTLTLGFGSEEYSLVTLPNHAVLLQSFDQFRLGISNTSATFRGNIGVFGLVPGVLSRTLIHRLFALYQSDLAKIGEVLQ